MSFLEKDLQSAFTKYLRITGQMKFSFVYELKITKTAHFAWRRVLQHQWRNLYNAKHDCVHHKISDMSLGYKPFDGFNICRIAAYLGICFYEKRKIKKLYFIDIDKANKHSDTHVSISEKEAQNLADYTVVL